MATDLTDASVPGLGPAGTGPGGSDDPFQRLHKMSTTAGVGAGDYVAINAAAIAALLLGVASATVLFGVPVLLLLPLAGVVLAVVAWVQIGHSNGTQTGRLLAVIGGVLSLALGGYQGGKTAVAAVRASAAQGAVVELIHAFGQDLADGKYPQAYARCDATFQHVVTEPQFVGAWQSTRSNPSLGKLQGIDWNGRLQFDTDLLRREAVAGGMVLIHFAAARAPYRTDMFFRQVDGQWQVDRIPQLFPPTATATPGGGSANPSAPSGAQPLGPARPPKP